MIVIHKDGRWYWAEVVDLDEGRRVGLTFKYSEREWALQEALRMEREYQERKKQKENRQ